MDGFTVDDRALKELQNKLKSLVPQMKKKLSTIVVKGALKTARTELKNEIKANFGKSYKGKDPRRLFKSVSSVQTKYLTEMKNIIAQIYFQNDKKIKSAETGALAPTPRTIAYWLDKGTKSHKVSKQNKGKSVSIRATNFMQKIQNKLNQNFDKEIITQLNTLIAEYLNKKES